jgi:hypothetical protein
MPVAKSSTSLMEFKRKSSICARVMTEMDWGVSLILVSRRVALVVVPMV